MRHAVAIITMFQNEARWLREWIEYHRLIGVTYFILFDHRSTDKPELILTDYINEGVVRLERVEQDPGGDFMALAVEMYNRGLDLARGQCEWCALIDADEFIVPKRTKWLPNLLREYKAFGALVVNWQMFGTSGVQRVESSKTMIESLRLRGKRALGHNIHVKSIVQLRYTLRVPNLHVAEYRNGFPAVNSNYQVVNGPFDRSIPVDKIQLNHYFCRDLDYLQQVKIPRRLGLGTDTETLLAWEKSMNAEPDLAIQVFVEPLKARLGLPSTFNWQSYLNRYPDLVRNGVVTAEQALNHWLRIGRMEGRNCE